jgi:hypothetical protein
MSEQESKFHKYDLPQVNEITGISQDYTNAFILLQTLDLDHVTLEQLADLIRKNPIKKYRERYPEAEYNHAHTEQTDDRIKQLDEIVDALNAFAQDPEQYDRQKISKLGYKAMELIYDK